LSRLIVPSSFPPTGTVSAADVIRATAGTCSLISGASGGSVGSTAPFNAAVASGDLFTFVASYEVA
jgi:hypothetical protein